jgi:hypothetical protein
MPQRYSNISVRQNSYEYLSFLIALCDERLVIMLAKGSGETDQMLAVAMVICAALLLVFGGLAMFVSPLFFAGEAAMIFVTGMLTVRAG